jgi:hypothetical protein
MKAIGAFQTEHPKIFNRVGEKLIFKPIETSI